MSGYSFNSVRTAAALLNRPTTVRRPPQPTLLSGCPQQAWESDRARREVNGRPAPKLRVSRVTSRLVRPVPSFPC
jgi:hypothetical protein